MKFGYARCSTKDQNLDSQIAALKKYGVDKIYEEKQSGAKIDRKALTELLGILREGDSLVVWKLDRLGRTTRQLLDLAEDFEKRGVNLVSLTDSIDTSTPSGKFFFTITAAFAELERALNLERTMAGLAYAKEQGRYGGRPKKDTEAISTAFKMYDTGKFTIKEIVEATGLARTTLFKYLREREAAAP